MEKAFRYTLSDDKTLGVHKMNGYDSSLFKECLIDGDLNYIFPNGMKGHEQAFEQILNLLLISSSEVCYDFLNYDRFVGLFVPRYLPIIRFQAEMIGGYRLTTKCMYFDGNKTKLQKQFIDEFLDNGYTFKSQLEHIETVDDFKAKDLSNLIRYEMGDIYENRRL